jgi:hypothetical protein
MGKTYPELRVVTERKIFELLPMCGADSPLEASGVVRRGENYFIVCDDIGQVIRIDCDFEQTEKNGFFGEPIGHGFESIAWSERDDRFFLVIEALPTERGDIKARLVEWDCDFTHPAEQWLDFTFESDNRGFEGLAVVERADDQYLLALCEGNKCRAGKKGRQPGGGRIQVFRRKDTQWRRVTTIELPTELHFEDYAGLALDGNRIAVVSQSSSGLWVGSLVTSSWTIDGPGQIYEYPRSRKDKIQYGNVEGVCWLAEGRVVVVSDRCKPDDPNRYAEKDQSIHIFEIPDV